MAVFRVGDSKKLESLARLDGLVLSPNHHACQLLHVPDLSFSTSAQLIFNINPTYESCCTYIMHYPDYPRPTPLLASEDEGAAGTRAKIGVEPGLGGVSLGTPAPSPDFTSGSGMFFSHDLIRNFRVRNHQKNPRCHFQVPRIHHRHRHSPHPAPWNKWAIWENIMKHGCMWKYLQIWSIHMHWESYPISGLFPTRFSFLFYGTVDLNAFLLLRVEALDAFDFGQFYNDRKIPWPPKKSIKSL